MSVKRIVVAHFSPTGGTKKVAMALEDGFLDQSPKYRYQVITYNCLSPKQRAQRVPEFTSDDLFVFCYPVFFGRMPWCFGEWPELKGNGATAIVCSVYGNRAIEDAERETMDMLTKHGFKVVAGIEAIAEHSQERTLAAHRPDSHDKEQLGNMAREIIAKIMQNSDASVSLPAYPIDMSTELKPRGKAMAIPKVLQQSVCNDCGRCVDVCPCGIIDPKTHTVFPELADQCMGCRACMTACRIGGRGFTFEENMQIMNKMSNIKSLNRAPKHNQLKWPTAS